MSDIEHISELRTQVHALDGRVSKLEADVAVLNSTQNSMREEQNQMREEMKAGFAEQKQILDRVFEDKRKWGEWARQNFDLKATAKWIGRWTIILIGCAIGVNNLPAIAKFFAGVFGAAQ